MKAANLIFTIILGGLIFGCTGDEKPIDAGQARISLGVSTTTASNGNTTARMLAPAGLSFTAGKIIIRELVFDGEVGGTSVSKTKEQISTIDYATGKVSPAISVTIPAGEYTDVNLGIEIQDASSKPSIVITGTYKHTDGRTIPVRFEFNSGEVFEAEASRVTIPEGADLVGKITFNAHDWFSVI
jgi:hypothetical protein